MVFDKPVCRSLAWAGITMHLSLEPCMLCSHLAKTYLLIYYESWRQVTVYKGSYLSSIFEPPQVSGDRASLSCLGHKQCQLVVQAS